MTENKKDPLHAEPEKTPKQKAWEYLKNKMKPVTDEDAMAPPFSDAEWDEIFAEDEARNGPL